MLIFFQTFCFVFMNISAKNATRIKNQVYWMGHIRNVQFFYSRSPGSCEINKKQSGNSFARHPVFCISYISGVVYANNVTDGSLYYLKLVKLQSLKIQSCNYFQLRNYRKHVLFKNQSKVLTDLEIDLLNFNIGSLNTQKTKN